MSESRMTLMLTLIAVELSCALLWALSGTFAAGALALTLGLGAVLAVFLPERYPPRGEGHRTGPPEGEACEGVPDKDTLRIGRIVG